VPDTFRIGGELEVNRLGFGAGRLTRRTREGVRVLRRAVELGANLIDTADIYGPETSEQLVAEALHPYDGVVVATKGGITYGRGATRPRDGRPEYLRWALEQSLRRLRVERIDLYHHHRHDPDVPVEESIGALEELRREGKIRLIGVSNYSAEQLRTAQRVASIATVQNEYSRGYTVSDDVLAICESEAIGFMPWRPLGEFRDDPVRELGWLLARSPAMLPIPGTTSVEHLETNMRAAA
jgi:aryl-alcohol dehydrogenase-like predicted oxidoreductase